MDKKFSEVLTVMNPKVKEMLINFGFVKSGIYVKIFKCSIEHKIIVHTAVAVQARICIVLITIQCMWWNILYHIDLPFTNKYNPTYL